MARAVEACEEDTIDYRVWVNETFLHALLLYLLRSLLAPLPENHANSKASPGIQALFSRLLHNPKCAGDR